MKTSIQALLGFLAIFSFYVGAYPNGQVQEACSTMSPNHQTTAQTIPAPYTLSVSKMNFTGGERITVTLSNTSSLQIEGFMIQARAADSNTPLGYFQIDNSDIQTLNCTTNASAVSHTSNNKKSNIQVTWVAPSSKINDVQIRATVVKNTSIYWENVISPKLMYVGSSGCQLLVPGLGQLLLSSALVIGALLAV